MATIITWALGVLATILGGLNIMQLLTFNSYKRKTSAEAYQAEINSLRSIIESNQAEIGRLSQRVEYQDRRDFENSRKYDELYQKYDALRDEFETYKINHK